MPPATRAAVFDALARSMEISCFNLSEPLSQSPPPQQDEPPTKASGQSPSAQELFSEDVTALYTRLSGAASSSGGTGVEMDAGEQTLAETQAAALNKARAVNAASAEMQAARTVR